VNKKIFVDDLSTDQTVEIARKFAWEVYENVKSFVSSGTREALKHVESELFVSVEQDVLLARDWWDKSPRHMNDPQVVVAQGIRVTTHQTLRCLDEYEYAGTEGSQVTTLTTISFVLHCFVSWEAFQTNAHFSLTKSYLK
jgi:hypothetical protein